MENLLSQNWLIQFRWYLLGITSIGFIISYTTGLSSEIIPAAILFGSVIAISNFTLRTEFLNLSSEKLLFGVLLLDTLLISFILYLLGGATNPFSILFLVYVVFSSILLNSAYTLIVVAVSVSCFGLLLKYTPEQHMHHASNYSNHLMGMWIAYSLVAIICAVTISALVRLLKRSLQKSEELSNNQLRLSSLTTIAAGAAHELRTPLNIISLCVDDAKVLAKEQGNIVKVNHQLELISDQISRCTQIIKDLGINSKEIEGEQFTKIDLQDFTNETLYDFKDKLDLQNILEKTTADKIKIPKNAIKKALRSLIQNALESTKNPKLEFEASLSKNILTFRIEDNGPGLNPEIIKRIGEPFVTTKAPGQGMGLGIFLSQLTARSYGGDLIFDPNFKNGTRALFSIKVK